MRIRRSEGIIERYGVTLSPGLPAENKIIETLLACPKGRRQQWLRKLLTLGIQNRQISLPIIDNWSPPQGDPVPNKLLSIGLDRRAPEDLAILTWIETLPLVRRSQALRSLLVIGIYIGSVPNGGAVIVARVPDHKTIDLQDQSEIEILRASAGVAKPTLSVKTQDDQIKIRSGKQENADILAIPTQKVRDNPLEVVELDGGAGQSERDGKDLENPPISADNEVDELPATETVISGLQEPIALDIDLSEFDGDAPEPPKIEIGQGLAAMRGLFS